jgi:hypothetical protein
MPKRREVSEDDAYVLVFNLERHGRIEVKGRVSISDLVDISYDDVEGTFMVYNAEGSSEWTSVHKDRNTAILLYLQKRLGIVERSEESSG